MLQVCYTILRLIIGVTTENVQLKRSIIKNNEITIFVTSVTLSRYVTLQRNY